MSYEEQLRVFKPSSKLSIKRAIQFTIFDELLVQISVVPTFFLFLLNNTTKNLSRIKNMLKNLLEAENLPKIYFLSRKVSSKLTHPTP